MEGDCCSSELSLWTEASGTDCNDSTVDCSSVNLPMPDESMMSCYSADLMLHQISIANDELNAYVWRGNFSISNRLGSGAQFIAFCN